MFKNLLLPLDGSHFSELALPLAIQIARGAGGTLHIVRVHVPAVSQANPPAQWDLDERVRETERAHLRAMVERARMTGIRATGELLDGPVVRAIQRYIAATEVDLMVMTTHGRSGLSRAVLGSIAERCVRTTNVPVLLLHPRAAHENVPTRTESLKRILVALDGSAESEAVVDWAVELAQLTGARVTLAQVATAPFDIVATLGTEAVQEYLLRACVQSQRYLDKVAGSLPQAVQADTMVVSADRAAIGILRCQQESGADIIAMATAGRGGWARIAIGSVAESVLHKTTVPVLMLRSAATTERMTDNGPAKLASTVN